MTPLFSVAMLHVVRSKIEDAYGSRRTRFTGCSTSGIRDQGAGISEVGRTHLTLG